LKVNIVPVDSTNTSTAISQTSLRNLRLIAPDGTTVLDSATDLESNSGLTVGTDIAAANDWVVTFTLANEYTIAKNTEVGFSVLADIPTVAADATDKVTLTFYQSAVPTSTANTMAHLLAVGQSSGTQLYSSTTGQVIANAVTITASGSQTVAINKATNWDSTSGAALAVGASRIVGDWKISDASSLNENAEITKIVLANSTGTTPSSFYLSNFELYHDGVKVATSPTMASDNTVTFGDGETTMFTVTDGDSTGKTLVVKCDIDDAAAKNSTIDFIIIPSNVTARGASTGVAISGSGNASTALTTTKLIKRRYATFVNVDTVATSVAAGTSTELLRFTVTPMPGETVDLSDMAVTLNDALGSTTTSESIKFYDVTNSRNVTLSGVTKFSGAASGDTIVTCADGYYSALDEVTTFSVRVDTSGLSANGSYQIGIAYAGDRLQIGAVTQDGLTGFAPMGDRIIGKTVTVTK
jgi:hypothetical protein